MVTKDMQPYPRFKDSGQPWLGRVPAHWGMERAKWLYGQMSRPVRDEDEVVTCFRDGTVTLRKKRRELGFTNSLKEIGYQGVRKGDLVIHAMDAFAGAVGVSDSDGKSTPVYAVCTPKPGVELDSRYYAYVIREMARSAWILALARGIRERSTDFRFDTFAGQTVPIPPLDEQRAIADYLDAHAVKVRRFIRNRRRLIEVLNEQKQAIINQAVTRGLNPNVPLKPSGIDWLGDIPEHWQTRRLKFLVRNVNEQTSSREPDEVYLALEHVEGWTGRINLPSENIEFDSQVKRFRQGDVLFGKLRPYLAKVTRPDVSGVCVGEFLVLRSTDEMLLPEFLEQELRSKRFVDIINSSTFGAKMPRADWTFIGNLVIVYPPAHAEQLGILEEIGQQTTSLQTAIDKAKREIDLIREYRMRLIADVVTGKVDVRGLAPDVPPVADEQIDEGIDNEEMLGDGEPELVEEAADGSANES